MTAADDCLEEAHADDNEQRADEEIGGNDKCAAGLADAAHVYEGKQEQDAEADGESVFLQGAGVDGDERPHAGRDADCRGEHIVDHERRCGEQAGIGAEVLRRNGVGAASLGICIDRLPVGKEDDDEQDDDGERDRDDVAHTHQTKRDEERQGCFWAVCRR